MIRLVQCSLAQQDLFQGLETTFAVKPSNPSECLGCEPVHGNLQGLQKAREATVVLETVSLTGHRGHTLGSEHGQFHKIQVPWLRAGEFLVESLTRHFWSLRFLKKFGGDLLR